MEQGTEVSDIPTRLPEPPTRPLENRLRVLSCGWLELIEVAIYSSLGVTLFLTASFALFMAAATLWRGLLGGDAKTIVTVIDRLLVVLMLVEVLHTVRISIRSHALVTEPFLVVGLIASIRRMLVITLDAASLTNADSWGNDGQSKLRASMLELGILGGIVLIFVFSIYLLKKSQPSHDREEQD
jgi:uncharacterized membrane protein (DUF373 family)